MRKMTDISLEGQRVLIREDLNVPISEGKVTSDARLRAALPTIQAALSQGAAVILVAHLGRPVSGQFDEGLSLAPVAARLSTLLNLPVRLEKNYLSGVDIALGEVVLCENIRFQSGECANDIGLAKKLASLADVFVMDAFGCAHRAHASTYGVAQYAKLACAGPLLVAELEALGLLLQNPTKPMVAIVGGSKVSTKLAVLEQLVTKVDSLIVGGGIANTFLAAAGYPVGESLYEADLIETAKKIRQRAEENGCAIPLPIDVVVAKEVTATAEVQIKKITDVAADDKILDIGPETAKQFSALLQKAETIVWNGPLGVFELEPFASGTQTIAESIASSKAFSIAGGGDTLAAIDKYNVASEVSYISTGGGAFLEFLEGKTLPAVAILK